MGVFDGLVNGFVQAIAGSRIDRMCAELGWSVDDRKGNRFRLDFNDPIGVKRAIYIFDDGSNVIQMNTYSYAMPHPSDVPDNVLPHLLRSNAKLACGKWHIDETDDGKAMFGLEYAALAAGLTAPVLKVICTFMLREVSDFDVRMEKAGLI